MTTSRGLPFDHHIDRDQDTTDYPDAHAVRSTAAALEVTFPNGLPRWVPRSVIPDSGEVTEEGDEGTLEVFSWWGEENLDSVAEQVDTSVGVPEDVRARLLLTLEDDETVPLRTIRRGLT